MIKRTASGINLKVSDEGHVTIPFRYLIVGLLILTGSSGGVPSAVAYLRGAPQIEAAALTKIEVNAAKDAKEHPEFRESIQTLEIDTAVVSSAQENLQGQVEQITRDVSKLTGSVRELVGEIRAMRKDQ